jgi:hypothetical protein
LAELNRMDAGHGWLFIAAAVTLLRIWIKLAYIYNHYINNPNKKLIIIIIRAYDTRMSFD